MATDSSRITQFLSEPTHDNLSEIILNPPAERAHCDFKETWPEHPRLAKHVLAIANTGGGIIIVGVVDGTGDPVGLTSLVDEVNIRNGLQNFLPHSLLKLFGIGNYTFPSDGHEAIADKRFQVLFIEDEPRHLPFISKKSSGEVLRDDVVYVRDGSSTRPARHDQLQDVINRRLETGYSSRSELDLETHVEQLRVLFGNMKRYHYSAGFFSRLQIFDIARFTQGEREPNPAYPVEDFEGFIVNMIKAKKRRIAIHLDVEHLIPPERTIE